MSSKLPNNHIPGNYQYVALHYGSSIQRQWHKNRHNLLKFLNFFDHKDVVLDLGCGSGNIILEFAPKVHSILGIDNNKECILFLEKKIKEENIKKAKVLKMDLTKLDLKGRKFTKIIMTEVLEHFDQNELRKIMQKIKNILTPEGKIFITTPNYQSPWPIMEFLIDKLKLTPKLWGEQHRSKFTFKKLEILMKEANLSIEKKGTLNAISPFIAPLNIDFVDKLSYAEFRSFPFGNLLYCVVSQNQALRKGSINSK